MERGGKNKYMLVGGLKRTDVQDRSFWRLGCKTGSSPAAEKKSGSRRMRRFVSTPKTNGS